MAFDKIQILKYESTSRGGSQNNKLQTEMNPTEDGFVGKGIDFVHNETNPYTTNLTRGIDLDTSGDLRFRDPNVSLLLKNVASKDYFRDMMEPTGIVDRAESTISFTDATRLFSIQPSVTSFDYYVLGIKGSSTGLTTNISDIEGIHVISINSSGTLSIYVNPSNTQLINVLLTEAIVSLIYWDATNKEAIYVADERHGITMDGITHAYNHIVLGYQYFSGLGLSDIVADEDGSLDTYAQFGVDSGKAADEDIFIDINSVSSTTGLPVYYRLGADGDWRKENNSGFSLLTGANGFMVYNEFTGDTWQKTEINNNNHGLVHVFASNEKDNPLISIMGQGSYNSKSDAQQAASNEINALLLGSLPGAELKPIATVIFAVKSIYANSVKATIVSSSDGSDYIDFRASEAVRGAGAITHGTLSGLQNDDHHQYLLLAGRAGQTIADDITIADTYGLYFKDANQYIDLDASDNLRFTDSNGSKLLKDLVTSVSYDAEETTNEDFTGNTYSNRTTLNVSGLEVGRYKIEYFFDFTLDSSDINLIYKMDINSNTVVENTLVLPDRVVSYMPIYGMRYFTLASAGSIIVDLDFKTSEAWGTATINYSNTIITKV